MAAATLASPTARGADTYGAAVVAARTTPASAVDRAHSRSEWAPRINYILKFLVSLHRQREEQVV